MAAKITIEDILKNRFIKWVEKENTNPNCPGVTKYFRVVPPSRDTAEKLHFKTLCIYAGVEALKFRGKEGAVKNANYWLEKRTKEELLETFFPKIKDTSLNSMF